MVWKHLRGRTTELHPVQSLRREPVHSIVGHARARAALSHTSKASSRARSVACGSLVGVWAMPCSFGGGRLMCLWKTGRLMSCRSSS